MFPFTDTCAPVSIKAFELESEVRQGGLQAVGGQEGGPLGQKGAFSPSEVLSGNHQSSFKLKAFQCLCTGSKGSTRHVPPFQVDAVGKV